MTTRILALVTCLLVGAVIAEQENAKKNAAAPAKNNAADAARFVAGTLLDDGFDTITTISKKEDTDGENRKKRSTGGVLGRFGLGDPGLRNNDGFTNGCGSFPGDGARFQGCFTPDVSYFQGDNFVRNYQRAGSYGDCLNYFNSLPMQNVAQIADGYTGVLNGPFNRDYSVSACQRCYGGNSGIAIRGLDRPYNHLQRNFIFRQSGNVQRAFDRAYQGVGYPGYGVNVGSLGGANPGYAVNNVYSGLNRNGNNGLFRANGYNNYGFPYGYGLDGRAGCNGADCFGAADPGCTGPGCAGYVQGVTGFNGCTGAGCGDIGTGGFIGVDPGFDGRAGAVPFGFPAGCNGADCAGASGPGCVGNECFGGNNLNGCATGTTC